MVCDYFLKRYLKLQDFEMLLFLVENCYSRFIPVGNFIFYMQMNFEVASAHIKIELCPKQHNAH